MNKYLFRTFHIFGEFMRPNYKAPSKNMYVDVPPSYSEVNLSLNQTSNPPTNDQANYQAIEAIPQFNLSR